MIFADNFVVTQAHRLGSTDSASLASIFRLAALTASSPLASDLPQFDFRFLFLYFLFEMKIMIAKPHTTSASASFTGAIE
jgi:hypothetical protein